MKKHQTLTLLALLGTTATAHAQGAAAVPAAGSPAPVVTSPAGAPPPITAPTADAAVTVPEPALVLPDVPSLGDKREAAAANSTPLSLQEVIEQTLLNNPQRAAIRAALAAAQARIKEAHSQGGLTVEIDAEGNLQHGYGPVGTGVGTATTTTGTGTGGSAGTGAGGATSSATTDFLGFGASEAIGPSATLPLYTGGRVKDATKVARYNAVAEADLTMQTEQDLVLAAADAYLAVLRNAQLLQVADSNMAVSRERQRIAQVRYNAGASPRLDVFSANTTLATAQQLRIAASNNLAQAKANVNTLMGRVPETPLQVQPITSLDMKLPLPGELVPGSVPSSTDLRTLADKSRPSIAESNANTSAAQANVTLTKDQRKPDVLGTASGLLHNPANFLGRFALTLGASLAQIIYDSGHTSSQIDEAQALLTQARANHNNEELNVANSIETSLLSLDSAQGQLSTADVSVSEASAALASAQLGFAAGASTSVDVSDAQANLLTAQTNAVNARFDVATSQAALSSAVGVLSGEGQTAYQQVLAQEKQKAAAAGAQAPKKHHKILGIF